jgi:hypothetical protein
MLTKSQGNNIPSSHFLVKSLKVTIYYIIGKKDQLIKPSDLLKNHVLQLPTTRDQDT